LRAGGATLAAEAIRRAAVEGELVYRARLAGRTPEHDVMLATLLAEDRERYVIPPMDRARIVKIERNGVLIAGTEVIARGRGMKNIKADYYRQTWWCTPLPPKPEFEGWRELASKEWAEAHSLSTD